MRGGFALGFLLLALAPGQALAAAGDLDPGFGGDGTVTVDFGGSESAEAITLQPDGKIVAAGYTGPPPDYALTRLNPDGTPDAGFGAAGKTTHDFGASSIANAVALDASGRIVAAGDAGFAFSIAVFDTAGNLDGSFGAGGTTMGTFDTGISTALAVIPYPDGRIFVAGHFNPGSAYDFGAARVGSDGLYDMTFDGDGRTIIDFGTDFDLGLGAVMLPGGKLVIGGLGGAPNNDCQFARLTEMGALDGSFSPTGMRTANLGGSDYCTDLVLDSRSRLVTGGRVDHDSTSDIVAARLAPDGVLDPAFGGMGFTMGAVPGPDLSEGVAIAPGDKVVVAGSTGGTGSDFLVARFNPNGMLDPGFGAGGIATADFGDDDYAYDVAVQPNGDVVAVGYTQGGDDFAFARFDGGPLEVEVRAKGRQDAGKLKAKVECSLDCEVVVQGKGKAGGERFKTKRKEEQLEAGDAEKLRLKLKPGDRDELAGESGKAKITATANGFGETDRDSGKVKLEG